LLGNLGGVRPALAQYGVSLGLQSVDEMFGNPNGGRAQGVAFDGENTLSLGVDLEKAASRRSVRRGFSSFGTNKASSAAPRTCGWDNLPPTRSS
jgi:carbohydrate-selective porin OprB